MNLTSHGTENLAFQYYNCFTDKNSNMALVLPYHFKHKSDNATLEELANQLEMPLQAQLEQDVSQW